MYGTSCEQPQDPRAFEDLDLATACLSHVVSPKTARLLEDFNGYMSYREAFYKADKAELGSLKKNQIFDQPVEKSQVQHIDDARFVNAIIVYHKKHAEKA
eukprot:Lankesteria_metandrocarpae@DN5442_c0_g1_i4.p5